MNFQIESAMRSRVRGRIDPAPDGSPRRLDVFLDGRPSGQVSADEGRAAPGPPGFTVSDATTAGFSEAAAVEIRAGSLPVFGDRRDLPRPARRLFFMHIPKTGVTSLNGILTPFFAHSYTHVESHDGPTIRSILRLGRPKSLFVSGHILFNAFRDDVRAEPTRLVTTVREPYSHLVSHVAWVHAMTRPDAPHPEAHSVVAEVGARIHAMDPSDERSVERWLEGFGDLDRVLFFNSQTRYLGSADSSAPIGPDSVAPALATLEGFDLVGRLENIASFGERLGRLIGVPLPPVPHWRQNPAAERFRPLLRFRERLRPLVEWDMAVYARAVAMEGLASRLARGWRRVVGEAGR